MPRSTAESIGKETFINYGIDSNDKTDFKKNGKYKGFDVDATYPKPYVHIELGAGNYTVDEDIHNRNKERNSSFGDCECKGCDYDTNRYRYKVLENTVKSLIEKNKTLEIFINDYECSSME